MLRLGTRTRDFIYDWVPEIKLKIYHKRPLNPYKIISDERYEMNLKYLSYMYNLLRLPGKPRDPLIKAIATIKKLELEGDGVDVMDEICKLKSTCETWD